MIKNGIPFDVAFAFYPEESLAYSVTFGEFEGGKFDWDTMSWRE